MCSTKYIRFFPLLLFLALILKSCVKEEDSGDDTDNFPDTPWMMSTAPASSVGMTSAVSGGTISWGGRSPVTKRGVCWSTLSSPTTSKSITSDGTGIGTFSSSITGLIPGTKYYVRSFATNSFGTGYGDQISFTTLPDIAVVVTSFVKDFTDLSAVTGGEVISEGLKTVTERGIFFGASPDPEKTGINTVSGSGLGAFSSNQEGLTPNTKYYVNAYAVYGSDTAYGEQVGFITRTSKISDIEGNIYYTQTIGNQEWMAQNLRTTKYADGELIPLVITRTSWESLADEDKAYCWYNNSEANKDPYGALYNWAASMNGAAASSSNPSGVQGVCPDGWHLPSYLEWKELEDYLGGFDAARGRMKEPGLLHWASPNYAATNESGFSGLPGGLRYYDGYFGNNGYSLGEAGYWWSASDYSPNQAYTMSLSAFNSETVMSGLLKRSGLSVRCVKNK